ncbi:ATP-binding cassette long-chain fatty acid transporter pxa2, partial [Linderina pennispora]
MPARTGDLYVGTAVRQVHDALLRLVQSTQQRQLEFLTRAVLLYARHQTKIRRSIMVVICIGILDRLRRISKMMTSERQQKTNASSSSSSSSSTDQRQQRVGKSSSAQLDKQFFDNMKRLVAIVIPGLATREFAMLMTHSCLLVFRTFLSVVVAALDGQIVSSLVRLNGREFLMGIVRWMAIAVPATLTNSLLNYLQTMLAIRFRQNLTEHVHAKYLSRNTYYA